MFIHYIANVFSALRILAGVVLTVDIIVFLCLCTTDILFDYYKDEFSEKLLKIMIITGIVCLILLVFLPGRSVLLG